MDIHQSSSSNSKEESLFLHWDYEAENSMTYLPCSNPVPESRAHRTLILIQFDVLPFGVFECYINGKASSKHVVFTHIW